MFYFYPCYFYPATNLDIPEVEVIYEYNKRVPIESVIKELKIGIGLEDMPTGDYFANGERFFLFLRPSNAFIFQHLSLYCLFLIFLGLEDKFR